MTEREHPSHASRKPYVRPSLEVYGTLLNLTANLAHLGALDGGSFPNDGTEAF